MDGEEQTYEENRKLFGSFICNYHHTSFDSIQMVLCFLYAALIPLPAYYLLKYLQKLFLLVRMNPAYRM